MILLKTTVSTISGNNWHRILKGLPAPLRDRAQVYHFEKDQKLHLFGRLLLFYALKDHGYTWEQVQADIVYSHLRRPSFNSIPWDFNISHSGELVLCALTAKGKVGLDVEKIRPVSFSDFKRVMNPSQWQGIRSDTDPPRKFFEYWTIKESVIKADGRGLALGLAELIIGEHKVVHGDHIWYIQLVSPDPQYCCCVASNQPIAHLDITSFLPLGLLKAL